MAHAQLDQWEAAEADLVAAATYAPGDPVVWRDLAAIYAATGRPDAAEQALKRAAAEATTAP